MIQLSVDQYQVGWICALECEYATAKAMLDERHQMVPNQDRADTNSYTLGRIHDHNVVIASLPAGVDGTNAAAVVATNLLRTFRSIRVGLMVGIGGGIPNLQKEIDIRLGDVVVSYPDGRNGGVVQYDKGKSHDHLFERKGQLNQPPAALLAAVANLRAEHEIGESLVPEYVKQMLEDRPKMRKLGYSFPESEVDVLRCAHDAGALSVSSCKYCDNGKVKREPRESSEPAIHYGVIASGNQVVKSASHRDQLRDECHSAICVEMEAAGLMNNFPCLVIRGICDYADSSKNDRWHKYAATTAAAFAKELLFYLSAEKTCHELPIQELDGLLKHAREFFHHQEHHNEEQQAHNRRQEFRYHDDRYRDCHRTFGTSDYERQKNMNGDAVSGTCRWVLDHPRYRKWYESTKSDLLWISADPGCGKSVLSKSLIDSWLPATMPSTNEQTSYDICYFFFKDNEEQSSLSTALCAILHQLFSHQPELIRHALPSFDRNDKEKLQTKTEELWRILQAAVDDLDARPVICVLDALDECRDGDRRLLVEWLCQSYSNPASGSQVQGQIKWLVTSRPHHDVQCYFSRLSADLPSIRLRGEDENDQIRDEIDLVIDYRLQTLNSQLSLSDAKREEIAQQLRETNNRTYLWLRLVLEEIEVILRRSARPNQMEIPFLPATVDEAYENILKRVADPEQKYYAKVVLTIILGAPRPLSISEMTLAFDVATLPNAPRSRADLTMNADTLGEKIRDWCGLFVFIKHDRLYLIHQTAKEFLVSEGGRHFSSPSPNNWKHCLHPLDISKQMAKIFVFFISLSDFENASRVPAQVRKESAFDTFFELACEHWATHTRIVASVLDDQTVSEILPLYDSETELFQRWRTTSLQHRIYADGMTDGIHLATFNRHLFAVQHILAANPDKINEVSGDGETALMIAAARGMVDIVKLLLGQPDIAVNVVGFDHGTALLLAAFNEHDEIVELLLAHPDIDVNLTGPLSAAAGTGAREAVKLLLAHPDINVNLGGRVFPRVYSEDAKCIYYLPEMPVDDANFGGPLSRAAENGFKEIVELLLAHPETNINLGQPLSRAAENGHKEIVELLLAYPETEVNLGGKLFESYGNDKGKPDSDPPDANGRRRGPLSRSAENGNSAIVELLLARWDVDVNFGQPLLKAVINGHGEVVKQLLEHPNIDLHPDILNRASIRIVSCSKTNMLPGPLGIDAVTRGLLPIAADNGDKEIVELLLNHPHLCPSCEDKFEQSLCFAAFRGHEDVLEVLLASSDTAINLEKLISLAAWSRHKEAVQLLLAQPGINDVNLEEALSNAAGCGRKENVKILSAALAVNMHVNLGQPLSRAIENGHKETVKLLLAQQNVSRYGKNENLSR